MLDGDEYKNQYRIAPSQFSSIRRNKVERLNNVQARKINNSYNTQTFLLLSSSIQAQYSNDPKLLTFINLVICIQIYSKNSLVKLSRGRNLKYQQFFKISFAFGPFQDCNPTNKSNILYPFPLIILDRYHHSSLRKSTSSLNTRGGKLLLSPSIHKWLVFLHAKIDLSGRMEFSLPYLFS